MDNAIDSSSEASEIPLNKSRLSIIDPKARIFPLPEYKPLLYAYSFPFRINRPSRVKKGIRVGYLCNRASELLNDMNLWEEILRESIRDPERRPTSLPIFIRRIRFIVCETVLRGILTIHKLKAEAIYEQMEEIFLKKYIRLYSTGIDTSKVVITLPKKKRPQIATEVTEPQALVVAEGEMHDKNIIDRQMEDITEWIHKSRLDNEVQPPMQPVGRQIEEIAEPSRSGKLDEGDVLLTLGGSDLQDLIPGDIPAITDFFSRLESVIIERHLEDQQIAKISKPITEKTNLEINRREGNVLDDLYKIEPYVEPTKRPIEQRVGVCKTHEVDMSRFMRLVSKDPMTGSATYVVTAEIHAPADSILVDATVRETQKTDFGTTQISEVPQDTVKEDAFRKEVPLIPELPRPTFDTASDIVNVETVPVIEPFEETVIRTRPEPTEFIPVVEEFRQHLEAKRPRLNEEKLYVEAEFPTENIGVKKRFSDRKILSPTKTIKDYFQPTERVLETEIIASREVPEIKITDVTLVNDKDVPATGEKYPESTSLTRREQDPEDVTEVQTRKRPAVFFRDVFKKENLFSPRKDPARSTIFKMKVAHSKRVLKNWFSRDALDKKYVSAALTIDGYEKQIPKLYGPYYMIHSILNEDLYYVESNGSYVHQALLENDPVYPNDERSLDEVNLCFRFLRANIDDISPLSERKEQETKDKAEEPKAELIVDDALRRKSLSPYTIRRPLSDHLVKPVDINEGRSARKSSVLAPMRTSGQEDNIIGSIRFSDIAVPRVEPLQTIGFEMPTASKTSLDNEKIGMLPEISVRMTDTFHRDKSVLDKISVSEVEKTTSLKMPEKVDDSTVRPSVQLLGKRSSDMIEDSIPRAIDRTLIPTLPNIDDSSKDGRFVTHPNIETATHKELLQNEDRIVGQRLEELLQIEDRVGGQPLEISATVCQQPVQRKHFFDDSHDERIFSKKLLPVTSSSIMDRIAKLMNEKTALSVTGEGDDSGPHRRKGPILFSELCPKETTSRFFAAKTFGLLLRFRASVKRDRYSPSNFNKKIHPN